MMTTKTTRRPIIEPLDNRTLMSGNVTVIIKSGRATITGDQQSNSIVLTAGGTENDHFTVDGIEGTTVNGKSSFSVSTYPSPRPAYVSTSMSIKMGEGDDHVNIAEIGYPQPVSIDLGGGNDRLDIQRLRSDFGSLDVFGGNGDDKMYLSGFGVYRRLRIFAGSGADYIGLNHIEASSGFDLIDPGGRTRITLSDVSGVKASQIVTGNSGDFLAIIGSHFHSLSTHLNGGNDRVSILSSFYDIILSPIDAGSGVNVIDDQSYVRWREAPSTS